MARGIQVGDKAPDFTLPAQSGEPVRLSDRPERVAEMVFPGLPTVICGKVVHRLVDNPRQLRTTARFLWTECGQKKTMVILP
jgi:peroxiredoxin